MTFIRKQDETIGELLEHIDQESARVQSFVKAQQARTKNKPPERPDVALPDGDEYQLRFMVQYACGNGDVEHWWNEMPMDEVYRWLAIRFAQRTRE